ncbi:transposase [Sodalis ligni]|uniref:Transposase n=1 Tax=Sodalis ligni TaxID=2697027 RepID=A0A4R1N4Y7_9GAMM|nr:transposase [Sodalis ligni]TCL02082.1 transposase [Sodalis ligni]
MKRISPEPKAATLAKLLPSYNMTVSAVAQMEGISVATLYNWRSQAKADRKPVPDADKNLEQSPAQARLAVIIETATLSETKLSEYCRRKGLYPEQIVMVCNEPKYASLPPAQVLPRLAGKGVYQVSESMFYRKLRRNGQVHHRGRSRAPR